MGSIQYYGSPGTWRVPKIEKFIGFRVLKFKGFGFGGLEFRGLGLGVWGLGFKSLGVLGLGVWDLGFRGLGTRTFTGNAAIGTYMTKK